MAKIIEFKHDIYSEDRGEIGAFYNSISIGKDQGVDFHVGEPFVQDRFSKSYKGQVRGFHGDPETWKYITCLIGKIKVVTWDILQQIRQEFYLEDGKSSILIPAYFLNAHQVLSDVAIFHYKQTQYYQTFPDWKQWSIHYNDLSIQPNWDLEPRRVSERDKNAQTLAEFYKSFKE